MTSSVRDAADRAAHAEWSAPPAPTDPWERFGWLVPALWMVFLVYPVAALLGSTASRGWVIVAWSSLVIFVVFYTVGFVAGMRSGTPVGQPAGRFSWIAFAAMIACAAASVPAIELGSLSYLPFIMSFASYGLSRRWHWITSSVSIALTAGAVILAPHGVDYVSLLVIVALLGVFNTVMTTLIIRSNEAERMALDLATSTGREAVARDVHDLVGHSLTVVRLKAQLAQRLIDTDPERAKAEIADIESLTAEAISGVRSTVTGVRIAPLATQLDAARRTLHAAGIELRVDGKPETLSPAQEITAGWILREAITNVLRHSHARHVGVRIAPGSLSIEDNGTGIPAGSTDAASTGNGIRGMRERAASAGAQFHIGPTTPSGTRVEVTW